MKGWVQHKARRLLLAGGVALVVGLPILACSGETAVEDGVTDEATDDGDEADDPADRLVGTFRMMPPESELRSLKVINAAISGKPDKKAKLGKMTKAEDDLFKDWSKKKGAEVKAMKVQLKFMKGSQFSFTDSDVTVQFGDEKFGPVPYEVDKATDSRTVVKFDPGLGNGKETHDIAWSSEDEGVDTISSADGGTFMPLEVMRR